jgi:hypothetical protein
MLVATDLLDEYEEFFYFEQLGVGQLLEMPTDELQSLFPRLGSRSRVQRFLAEEHKKADKVKLWQLRSPNGYVHQHHDEEEEEEELVPSGFTVGFTASRCEHHTTVTHNILESIPKS